jgi:hypothetical protein
MDCRWVLVDVLRFWMSGIHLGIASIVPKMDL